VGAKREVGLDYEREVGIATETSPVMGGTSAVCAFTAKWPPPTGVPESRAAKADGGTWLRSLVALEESTAGVKLVSKAVLHAVLAHLLYRPVKHIDSRSRLLIIEG